MQVAAVTEQPRSHIDLILGSDTPAAAKLRAYASEYEWEQIEELKRLVRNTTSAGDGQGSRAKGGRPRSVDDDWAHEQVRVQNRKPEDVYPEWLKRIGDRADRLANPRDSFNKAVSLKRKKRK